MRTFALLVAVALVGACSDSPDPSPDGVSKPAMKEAPATGATRTVELSIEGMS